MERLLPGGKVPEAVMLWIEGRESEDESNGGELFKQSRAATEWVLDVLCHAHEDSRLKRAARKLLAGSSLLSTSTLLTGALGTFSSRGCASG